MEVLLLIGARGSHTHPTSRTAPFTGSVPFLSSPLSRANPTPLPARSSPRSRKTPARPCKGIASGRCRCCCCC